MGGRLYLPIFLLRVGLFTLINMDYLIALTKPFLPCLLWWCFPGWWVISSALVDMYGRRCLKMFFKSFPNVVANSPIYSSLQSHSCATVPINNSTFLFHDVFIFRWHQEVLKCSVSFEVGSNNVLTAKVLEMSPWPCIYGMTMYPIDLLLILLLLSLLLLLPLLLLLVLLCSKFLYSILSNVHWEYLHLVRTSFKYSFPVWRSYGEKLTALALWCSAFMILYMVPTWWWLSQCKYWSMHVGFLYTLIDEVLSGSSVTKVSKNGIEPPGCVSSTVSLM